MSVQPGEGVRAPLSAWLRRSTYTNDETAAFLRGEPFPSASGALEAAWRIAPILDADAGLKEEMAIRVASVLRDPLWARERALTADDPYVANDVDQSLHNALQLAVLAPSGRLLAEALYDLWRANGAEGGWRGEAHRALLLRALATNQVDDRMAETWDTLERDGSVSGLVGDESDGRWARGRMPNFEVGASPWARVKRLAEAWRELAASVPVQHAADQFSECQLRFGLDATSPFSSAEIFEAARAAELAGLDLSSARAYVPLFIGIDTAWLVGWDTDISTYFRMIAWRTGSREPNADTESSISGLCGGLLRVERLVAADPARLQECLRAVAEEAGHAARRPTVAKLSGIVGAKVRDRASAAA